MLKTHTSLPCKGKFCKQVGKENAALIVCIELLLEAVASWQPVTLGPNSKELIPSWSVLGFFCVWTLHSTVLNPNGKLDSERCKTVEEKISKWKTTTLSSVFAPLISKTSDTCYKHNELIISISPWGCIFIRNLQCFSQWQIYLAF